MTTLVNRFWDLVDAARRSSSPIAVWNAHLTLAESEQIELLFTGLALDMHNSLSESDILHYGLDVKPVRDQYEDTNNSQLNGFVHYLLSLGKEDFFRVRDDPSKCLEYCDRCPTTGRYLPRENIGFLINAIADYIVYLKITSDDEEEDADDGCCETTSRSTSMENDTDAFDDW